MSPTLHTLVEFVEGRAEAASFAAKLYGDPDLEGMLSSHEPPKYAHTGHTLYHYLIALDYTLPRDVLTAQGALSEALRALNVTANISERQIELLDLIHSAQPKWLDADARLVQSILTEAPSFQTKSEMRAWLKARLLERHRYLKKPPVWLQSPNWPIGKEGPLVFLGQVSVEGYLHDDGAAYVFHDPSSGECVTVLQTL
jgi:hypothetical protein